ncbi:hypothetical protein [Stenotrophomonas maltophilia]|uniref:hypothetical protein n=1 Tax=Stenotrophomonas maltophilia TaxID=40324 RepID=UPI0012FDA29E|nr:hypothetical protein [Stenotrophomonas maltophilia]MBH1694051.1 hypothetical protein [Stenotrophomonas maltophilia]
MEIPIELDKEVGRALLWMHHIAGPSLADRLEVAKTHFLKSSIPANGSILWPSPMGLLPPEDMTAGFLLQATALVQDRRFFDARLAPRVIPFLKLVGKALKKLHFTEGAEQRVKEFLNPKNKHPEGSLLELAVASRYLLEGYRVRFIPESRHKTPDLELIFDEGSIQIECKRLQPGAYEKRESDRMHRLFRPACDKVDAASSFKHLDVTFKSEISAVPDTYLAEHMQAALDDFNDSYEWEDQLAKGTIRQGNLAAVVADTAIGAILVGPKLFRLFTNSVVPSQRVLFGARGESHELDPRYLDNFDAIALCSWDTVNEESMTSRSRHFGSKLAEIDAQLAGCSLGAAHVVVDAERDSATADLRRRRIREKVCSFDFKSKLVILTTHYLLSHTAEGASWTIDETAEPAARTTESLLEDPRLFLDAQILGDAPAWHQPPPK